MDEFTIIGHRGARDLAPGNTLPSLQAAINLKLPFVEFDVTFSRDNVPIVVHQETLQPDRAFSALELSGRNPAHAWAREHNYPQLRKLDAGAWYEKPEFKGITIPTLEECLSLTWKDSVPVIDLIDATYWKDTDTTVTKEAEQLFEICLPLLKAFRSSGHALTLLSFNPYLLELGEKHLPEASRVFAAWKDERGNHERVFERVHRTKAEALTIADYMLIEEPKWCDLAREQGTTLWVYDQTPDLYEGFTTWNVEERKKIWRQVIEQGVNGIECDFPSALKELVKHLD